jgi:hypothetical protein
MCGNHPDIEKGRSRGLLLDIRGIKQFPGQLIHVLQDSSDVDMPEQGKQIEAKSKALRVESHLGAVFGPTKPRWRQHARTKFQGASR